MFYIKRYLINISKERAALVRRSVMDIYSTAYDGNIRTITIFINLEDPRATKSTESMRSSLCEFCDHIADSIIDPEHKKVVILLHSTTIEQFVILINKLQKSQSLFVAFFAVSDHRADFLDWSWVYGEDHILIAESLIDKELAICRMNLKSQDRFELSVFERS